MSEQIEFHAADGFALAGTVHRPRADPRFALLISSGTGFPRTFYDAFGAHAAARGGLALTYDYRGIGGSRPTDLAAMTMDYPDWGRLDLPAAAAALAKRAGGLPLLHVGHSVGGHLVGFMPEPGVLARHAFVAVGSGYWGRHRPGYRPFALFFWWGLGPASLLRHGYVKSGRMWRGADLPRGVFETWRRWCHRPDYFRGELEDRLRPHAFETVDAPIHSWVFSDDPIANPAAATDLLACYPNAPARLSLRRPADYGLRRIGHEGAFRRGMTGFWDDLLDDLVGVDSAPGAA